MPLTVIGDVLYDAPLPGVEIVGALLGGGCFFVASRPYVFVCGSGIGIWLIAPAVDSVANKNKASINAAMLDTLAIGHFFSPRMTDTCLLLYIFYFADIRHQLPPRKADAVSSFIYDRF